jgi:hypothetical protein
MADNSNKPNRSIDGVSPGGVSESSASEGTNISGNTPSTNSQQPAASPAKRERLIKNRLANRILNFLSMNKDEEQENEDQNTEEAAEEELSSDINQPFNEDIDQSDSSDESRPQQTWDNPEQFIDDNKPKEQSKPEQTPLDTSNAAPVKPPTNELEEKALPGGQTIDSRLRNLSNARSMVGTARDNENVAANKVGGDKPAVDTEGAVGTTGFKFSNWLQKQLNKNSAVGGARDNEDVVKQKMAGAKKAKKAGDDAKKVRLWITLLKNFWPGIAIVLSVLGVAMGIGLVDSLMKRSGGSPVEAASPIKDKDWLNKLLLYTNDKNVKKEINDKFVTDVSEALIGIQGDPAIDADTKAKALSIDTKLKQYQNSATPQATKAALGQEIVVLIQQIVDKYGSCKTILNDSFFSFNKIDLDSFNASGKLKNGRYINPHSCTFLQIIKDHATEWNISPKQVDVLFLGNHRSISYSGDKSHHPFGHAMDINSRNGLDETYLAKTLSDYIHNNETTLRPAGIVPYQGYFGKYIEGNYFNYQRDGQSHGDTTDHIHIDFIDKSVLKNSKDH